jgi:cysteine-rich repeat protein
MYVSTFLVIVCSSLFWSFGILSNTAEAVTISTATTTINLSICGNVLVDAGEECDVPGETGVYSTTITGRQCTAVCQFGPYCGDGILQTQFTEECDDGNNDDGDFCSAECTVEPAGSGGGGTSGGGGSGGGGSRPVGDTQISVTGIGYPGQTINFLLDTRAIGAVRAGTTGRFEFATEASPGTATLGVWALDFNGRRSITLNNTFDVTQGAVTNMSGLILPPTIFVASPNVIPGSTMSITGQSIPTAKIDIHFNNSEIVESTQSGPDGRYTLTYNTSRLRNAEYTIKARSVTGTAPLLTQSSFSSSLQLFVGVDGKATTPSDLSRDSKVNLTDFSILIFWWQTPGGDSDPPADINSNGRVGLEDFSILLFNWTG